MRLSQIATMSGISCTNLATYYKKLELTTSEIYNHPLNGPIEVMSVPNPENFLNDIIDYNHKKFTKTSSMVYLNAMRDFSRAIKTFKETEKSIKG